MTLTEQFYSLKNYGYVHDAEPGDISHWESDDKDHRKQIDGSWPVVGSGDDRIGKDDKGYEFETTSSGSINFGKVTKEMADAMGTKVVAPIRYSSGNFEYGKKHLEENHLYDIEAYGFKSSNQFVEYVAQNFNEIYRGQKYEENGKERQTYLLAIKNSKFTLYIELRKNDEEDYYSVGSGGIISHSKEKKEKNRLWSRSTQDSQVADALAGVCACPLFIRNGASQAAMPSSHIDTLTHGHAEVKSLWDLFTRLK